MAKKSAPKQQVRLVRKPGSRKVEVTGTMPTADLAARLNDIPVGVVHAPASIPADEKIPPPTAEIPCTASEATRESEIVVAASTDAPVEPAPGGTEGITKDRGIMELTFTKNTAQRKSQAEVYVAEGYPGSVRFSKTLFPTKNGPEKVTVTADFREARKAETKEERKARLKTLPKPTAEQRLQKIEARAAKLRKEIAEKQAAPEAEAVPA